MKLLKKLEEKVMILKAEKAVLINNAIEVFKNLGLIENVNCLHNLHLEFKGLKPCLIIEVSASIITVRKNGYLDKEIYNNTPQGIIEVIEYMESFINSLTIENLS